MISKIKQLFTPKLSKPGEAYIAAIRGDLTRLDKYKWGEVRRQVRSVVSNREWNYICKLETDLQKEKVAAEIAGLLLTGAGDEEDKNIMFVALTRAKDRIAVLKINEILNQLYQS